MTYEPGVKVTDTRNGDRGVIRSAHGETMLVAWDDGGSEYVNAAYLTSNGKPTAVAAADAVDVEPAPPPAPATPARRKWSREECLQAIREWAEEHGSPPAQADWDPGIAKAQGHPERAERFHQAAGRWPSSSVVKTVCGGWSQGIRDAGYASAPAGGRPAKPKATPPPTPAPPKPAPKPAAAKPTPPTPPTQAPAATGNLDAWITQGRDLLRSEVERLERDLEVTRELLARLEAA